MLRWRKLGRLFNPAHSRPWPWMQEFAQCPTPFVLNDDVLRVYFACRPRRGADRQYVSHPAYVDLARDDLTRIVRVAQTPLLPGGDSGTFDEFGAMPGSVLREGSDVYLYYTGWTRMQSVPYTLAIGLAVSRDGGETFFRAGPGPVLGLSLDEPYFVTGPVVRIVDDQWIMWYLSCRRWLFDGGQPEPVYQIARAGSSDGIHWQRESAAVMPLLSENECQDILAPFFFAGTWHAIFAWRQPSAFLGGYRLGYAWSTDLTTWQRDDSAVGIELSADGWDSQMMCYPQVIEVDGRILMFYCGNDFGREGFGVAELVADAPPVGGERRLR
ncbi:hypothetical protein [Accumulibacter sp.]|uniref:hypothetical protein n=1 Tax=Accumulibacter sp. TaxID=2053492 RepID=UPI00261768EC|nr:hypothetical protein [Accumulibacter sp.]